MTPQRPWNHAEYDEQTMLVELERILSVTRTCGRWRRWRVRLCRRFVTPVWRCDPTGLCD